MGSLPLKMHIFPTLCHSTPNLKMFPLALHPPNFVPKEPNYSCKKSCPNAYPLATIHLLRTDGRTDTLQHSCCTSKTL